MNRLISSFLDRLAERFTAIAASVISSRVEGLQAVAQADQQSQLEDLARKYEAEGKTAIAQSLRERALRLTSSDLTSEAIEMIEAVGGEQLKLNGPASSSPAGHLEGVPDFSAPTKARKKPRALRHDVPGKNANGPDASGLDESGAAS
jgi:hypothetical protein